MPSSEASSIKQERERLRQLHAAGASGLSIVRALSDSVDRAIREIWDGIEGTGDAAVVALGGYGRRELSPASDVDLIVLHRRGHDVAPAAKSLSYELWDAGLELGYAVYTPKEAIRLSRRRLDSETAFLDARLVAGDAELFVELTNQVKRQAVRSPKALLARLREATAARRAGAGDAGAELEPNLKEGRGGLRDLVTIRWVQRVGGMNPDLVGAEELELAADFIHRVRNELHFATGRRSDVLLMQHQDRVAEALFTERGEVAQQDELMHRLYRHCRTVAFALDSLLHPLTEPPGGSLRLTRQPEEPWDAETRREFIELIQAGYGSRFRHLEQTGVLNRILPEWSRIWCLPQRNVYHRWAVDVHSLEVTSILAGLDHSDDELVRRVAAESASDREILFLAGLLHDIGKGDAGDHAEKGEALARAAVARMGLDPASIEEVSWLVRHHLLLAETATRRDIGDERLVGQVAEKIVSELRLRLLYLLTVADGIATGPAGWGRWKSTLVSQLFTTLTHFLEQKGLFGRDAVKAAQERTELLVSTLGSYPHEEVRMHVENMPRAWLLGQQTSALVEQSQMMLDLPRHDEIKLRAIPQSQAGVWEVTLVARDRPGLFSKISGSLSLHGLNVVAAEVYTREDGVALEVFRLQALGDEDRRFEHVVEDARKALRGRLALDVRLAEKRRDYAGRPGKGKREPPQVVFDNRASDFYTVIEVHATDRVGLLYTITRALADLSIDIHLAKISTYAEDVVDVFYVRDLDGQKVTEPDHLREIERTILYRLAAEE